MMCHNARSVGAVDYSDHHSTRLACAEADITVTLLDVVDIKDCANSACMGRH